MAPVGSPSSSTLGATDQSDVLENIVLGGGEEIVTTLEQRDKLTRKKEVLVLFATVVRF